MPRIHVVGLPHTQVSDDFVWCAYTSKVRRLAKMMHLQGIPMFLYAGDATDEATKLLVAEDVPIVGSEDRKAWYGVETWPEDWVFNQYDSSHESWRLMNNTAADEIAARWQVGDILGVIAGVCQEQIGRLLSEQYGITAPVVEWGIGYTGVFAPYRVYESYAHRHHVAGLLRDDDFRPMDTVIPNAFDVDDFVVRSATELNSHGGYLLYLGRMIERKGLDTVQSFVNLDKQLVLTAGQGEIRVSGAVHCGVVRGSAKAKLIAGAQALLVPTRYCEPFGGVAVEAIMSGTPAVTTDWGAFTETVPEKYRASSFEDFRSAVDRAAMEDRFDFQQRAWDRFSLEAVSQTYAEYFYKVVDHHRSR